MIAETGMSKYVDIEKIGSGGFGNIMRCKHESSGELFARKVLVAADADSTSRFQKEARLLASLDHPNIVKVVAKRLLEPPYYYVMPLYSHSLRELLPKIIKNESQIVPIFAAVLSGVAYAHKQGVIHRDLKPENVLLNSPDDVVVSDFGLGRQIDAASTRLTRTGFGMGTFYYTAPEQIQNAKSADKRSDIFSLGQMLYELYTGPLFSPVQDLEALPPGIRFIVSKCTQIDPDKRFQTITVLKKAFSEIFDSEDAQTDIEELHKLKTKLSAPGSLTATDATRFFRLVAEYERDSDLIHEIFMQLDGSMAAQLFEADPRATRKWIARFVSDFEEKSWGFDYTDTICHRCKAIYEHVSDAESRAAIIVGLMTLGVRHNRFYVLETFAELIAHPTAEGELDAVRVRIREADKGIRERASEWAPAGKLPPPLRRYFEFKTD
jgi:serine/threonine protein kinase